jgi:hypothetical protein
MKKILLCLLAPYVMLTARAEGPVRLAIPDSAIVQQLADTVAPASQRRTSLVRKAVVPVALIGLGITHMDDEGLFEGSEGLRRVVRRHYDGFETRIDNYTYYAPLAMTVGLNIAGVKGEHQFAEQAILLGMTYFLNKTLTNNLKSMLDVPRPDGTTNDAFPSGHSSSAFAYATFFHKEYGKRSPWYSVAGYSFAVATGAMRILNDRHWLSDVLAGAGIGILSTEAVYLIYPHIQKRIARGYLKKQQMAVLPYYTGGAGGIAVVYRLP